MPAELQPLLEELSNAPGPTGFEGPVRAIVRRELEPLADAVETDGLGSLVARFDGASERPRVMLAAHMDELGLLVRRVTDEGYIKFQTLGGWLDQSLINQRWSVLTREGPVPGVTGIKTVHVMTLESRKAVFKRDELFIDVGATSRRTRSSGSLSARATPWCRTAASRRWPVATACSARRGTIASGSR